MRAHLLFTLLASLVAMGGAGCGWQSPGAPAAASGTVAVIDLDEIARRLGSDRQIAEAVTQRQTALSQQLVDLAKSYSTQIAEQKAKLAAAEGQTAEVTVASWEKQASANLTQVKHRAEADLANHRAQLVQKFRDQIKPVARRVAQQRGLSVIVTRNDSVVYDFSSNADITDAVVDELLAAAPRPAATPEPTAPK